MYSQLTRSNLLRALRVGMNHTSQIYCTYVYTGILSDVRVYIPNHSIRVWNEPRPSSFRKSDHNLVKFEKLRSHKISNEAHKFEQNELTSICANASRLRDFQSRCETSRSTETAKWSTLRLLGMQRRLEHTSRWTFLRGSHWLAQNNPRIGWK